MTVYEPNFCPYCGEPVETNANGTGYCADCDRFVGQAPVPVVECTVVDGDQALVIQRATGRNPGAWALPDGHVDTVDNSPASAAIRELCEETALHADPVDLQLCDTLLEKNDDGSIYLTISFVVSVADVDGDARIADKHEVSAVQFVDPTKCPTPTFRPTDPERLAQAVALVHGD